MLELIYIIFALPVVCAALAISCVLGSGSLLHWLNRLTAAAVGVAVILLAQSFTPTQPFNSEYVYLDALNVWVILIITALYVAAAWVSKSYLLREHSRGYLSRTPGLLCFVPDVCLDYVSGTDGKKSGIDVGRYRGDNVGVCFSGII